ncbi:MAG: InlB B-repeat-containing protein [Firmicutes bacterium]|nr:InlB B-repeat-containing protein [Bacillota bacterium]
MKKITTLIISAVFILSMLTVGLVMANPTEQRQNSGTVMASGTGTELDPFLIGDATTLRSILLANAGTANRHFRLTADIYLPAGNWAPIALFAQGSVFEGNNHRIVGMRFPAVSNQGMFINFLGQMQNVTFENVMIGTATAGATTSGIVASNINTGTASGLNIGLDNVHVRDGSIRGSQYVGGFFGSIVGVGNAAGTRNEIRVENSSVSDVVFNGGPQLGGLVGEIGLPSAASNMNVTFRGTSFSGTMTAASNVNGGIFGGIRGGVNRNVVIEYSMVTGSLNMTGITNHNGGFIGHLNHGTNNVRVDIRNSLSTISSSGTHLLSGAIFGDVSLASCIANLFIHNTYFSTTAFPTNRAIGNMASTLSIPAANVTTFPGNTITAHTALGRTAAQIADPSFVNILNQGTPGAAMFIEGPNWPILRAAAGNITLDGNGGTVNGYNTYDYQWDAGLTFDDLPVPSRTGNMFLGWSGIPTGGTVMSGTDLVVQGSNLFAQWQLIQYTLAFEDTSTVTQTTLFRIHTPTPNIPHFAPVTFTPQFISGDMITFLNTPGDHFVGWQVEVEPNIWVDLGSGTATGGAGGTENVLEASYFLNAEILSMLPVDSATLTVNIRALFQTIAPRPVSFISAQPGYGILLIDGQERAFGTTLNFSGDGPVQSITVEAIPHPFRQVTSLGWSTSSTGPWSPITGPILVEVAGNPVYINAEFALVDVTLNVVSNIYLDGRDSEVFDGPTTATVQLGDTFDGLTMQTVPGLARVISNLHQNVRIGYTYFNMQNGEISFDITEAFLAQHADDNNTITVEALFVRQFAIDISLVNEELGQVAFTVTPEGGRPTWPLVLEPYYDVGTEIRIAVQPDMNASIYEIDGLNTGELNTAGNLITIVLIENRTNIVITFAHAAHNITVTARTTAGWVVTEEQGIKMNLSAASVSVNGTIAELNAEYDDRLFAFQGWYTMKDGELEPIATALIPDLENPHNLDNFFFSSAFVASNTSGLHTEFVAVFLALNIVEIAVEGQGTVDGNVVTFDGTNWVATPNTSFSPPTRSFETATFVRLTPTAGNFYELTAANIQGPIHQRLANGDIIVQVVGSILIEFNFTPQAVTLVVTEDISNGIVTLSSTDNVVRVGDTLTISFTPNSLFQRTTFKVMGEDVAVVNNSATIQVTQAWLYEANRDGLHIEVGTSINTVFMIGMIAMAVLVPLLVLGLLLIMLSNAKKKRQYAELQKKQQAGAIRMNQADIIKQTIGGAK